MTVSTSNNSVVYRGNGATTAFPVPFKVLDADHLSVTRRVFTSGETDHTYTGTDYSYSGFGASSGTLTLAGAALSSTYELVIERNVPITQDLDIVNAGGFYPESVEEQLDLTTMAIQQLSNKVDRAILAPVGESLNSLPSLDSLVGRFITFDADGNPISSSGTGADGGLRADLAADNGSSLISYGPRSLLLKLREHPSLYDYGAVEGEDCTDAFLEADDDDIAELLIPEGSFGLSESVTFSINLTGQGHNSIINVLAAIDRAVVCNKISARFGNFMISCNSLAKTGLVGLQCQSSTFSGIKIDHSLFDAAELEETGNNSGSSFLNCQFTNAGTTTTGTCSTSGTGITWSGADLTTLGIRPYEHMVRVGTKDYTIASVTDATHLVTTQTIGTNAAGTVCKILQGSGLLINNNGNNSGIYARGCFAHICAAAGYKEMALYGMHTEKCFTELCGTGRVVGLASVVNTFGAKEVGGYHEGPISGACWLMEHSSNHDFNATQLPGVGVPGTDLLNAIRILNPTLVTNGRFSYGGLVFDGNKTDVSNPSTQRLVLGEEPIVNTAAGSFTLLMPNVPAGSVLETNLKILGGLKVPVYFGSLAGATCTFKTDDGRTINNITGTTGVTHTGDNKIKFYTFKPDGNWLIVSG